MFQAFLVLPMEMEEDANRVWLSLGLEDSAGAAV